MFLEGNILIEPNQFTAAEKQPIVFSKQPIVLSLTAL